MVVICHVRYLNRIEEMPGHQLEVSRLRVVDGRLLCLSQIYSESELDAGTLTGVTQVELLKKER